MTGKLRVLLLPEQIAGWLKHSHLSDEKPTAWTGAAVIRRSPALTISSSRHCASTGILRCIRRLNSLPDSRLLLTTGVGRNTRRIRGKFGTRIAHYPCLTTDFRQRFEGLLDSLPRRWAVYIEGHPLASRAQVQEFQGPAREKREA